MPFNVKSETLEVQRIEGEIHIGTSYAFKGSPGYENVLGFDYGAELRYNLKKVPVALGIMFEEYDLSRSSDEHGGSTWEGGELYGVTGEYNFRRGKNCNPFVGMALGGMDDATGDKFRPFVRPKIGVEMFHHLRISLSATLTCAQQNGFSISIGWVIGGSPKNNSTVKTSSTKSTGR